MTSVASPVPIAQASLIADRLWAVEEELDAMGTEIGKLGMNSVSNDVAEVRYSILDAIYATRATSLPDLIPQLGWAFEKLDNLIGFGESDPIREDLLPIRFALASALVVIRDAIPPADLRCGYLVDQAVRLGLKAEEQA